MPPTRHTAKATPKPPPVVYEPESEPLVFTEVAGDRFFSPETAQILQFAQSHRAFRASGFTFCDILNNATFDATVPIPALGGSVAQTNADQFAFVEAVDAKAHEIYTSIMLTTRYDNYHPVQPNPDELNRLSCYFAAEGTSSYANFTTSRLLIDLDPINYFRKRIPAIIPNPSMLPGTRRKYLIAYLLMVHEEAGFKQLSKLIDTLDDGDAIILIHVDNRKRSAGLQDLLDKLIRQRERRLGRPTNVFLANYRFCNIWGHSSLVLTQLSGFWELLDMADWDYVINLSNYDFPLKRNREIHAILSRPHNKNRNFIEYWPDTQDLAERFYRAHIGVADFSSLFHPNVLGVTSWPFPRWRAYKHHQWMIVTPDFVRHLRENRDALNFLAFAEHTYIPDESYFATVLVNSPKFRDTVVNDNKRYLRFAGSDAAHPSWLGYLDRFLFPSGEPEPSFYFIRKFNYLGESFREQQLLEWINANHMTPRVNASCLLEDASVRIECLREFGSKIAQNNELIVVPVNHAFLMQASNLRCSLARAGINNVVYWSLSLEVHNNLLEKGSLSIFLPGFPSTGERQEPGKTFFTRMMRFKPKVLQLLLDAGFHVWYMDADTVALRDFRRDVVADPDADVYVALDNDKRIDTRAAPVASAGIMYLRATKKSRAFLQGILAMQAQSLLLDDQDALRKVIAHSDTIETKYVPVLPSGAGALITSGAAQGRGDAGAVAGGGSRDFVKRIPVDPSAPEAPLVGSKIQLRFLDQFQFVNGYLLFGQTSEVPMRFDQFAVVHTRPMDSPARVLRQWGLWLLDEKGKCAKDVDLEEHQRRLVAKVAAEGRWTE
ncbi:Xylosyltransferase 2 [Polyrhizophydium stewartii]|uniref:protein xylosyltransferase n=1 Tax=Polyrhizophydium stewartii TaxID=2732419 RepID=A0ABR4NF13_9FUNG